jgi:hypothetical protein
MMVKTVQITEHEHSRKGLTTGILTSESTSRCCDVRMRSTHTLRCIRKEMKSAETLCDLMDLPVTSEGCNNNLHHILNEKVWEMQQRKIKNWKVEAVT